MKEKIKEDRAKRGLTQVEYGNLLRVKETTVRNWEKGRRTPHEYVMMLITFSTEALLLAHKKMVRDRK